LKHFAAPEFWHYYRQLPDEVRRLAHQKFELLKADPRHSSIRLKKIGQFWSAGLAFAIELWPRSASMASFGSGSARTARTINLGKHTGQRHFVEAATGSVNPTFRID